MPASASLLVVPFREVRHDQPDDCLHHEPLEFRGQLHRWEIPAHRHEALHQFNLLSRGGVIATVDGLRHRLKAPAAWMVAPGVMHAFVYEPDSCGEVVSVPTASLQSIARSPNLQRLLAQAVVVSGAKHDRDFAELRDLFGCVAREFADQKPGRSESLAAHATLLALWFVRHAAANDAAIARPFRDTIVDRYRALLEQHFRKHWPVREYARLLKVTPDHLSRRCRAVTGSSALDLAHERIVLEARRMLAYTPTPVAAIATQLGFDDPAYFSRLFARMVGRPPSAYRTALDNGLGVPPVPAALAPRRGAASPG
jgi:AraC family transcriptional activator of pobA